MADEIQVVPVDAEDTDDTDATPMADGGETPSQTDESGGVLGFAATDAAKNVDTQWVIDRLPSRTAFAAGFAAGSVSVTFVVLLVQMLIG